MSETRQQHWCERCGGVILPLSDATMVDGKPYHPTQLCDPSAAPRRDDATEPKTIDLMKALTDSLKSPRREDAAGAEQRKLRFQRIVETYSDDARRRALIECEMEGALRDAAIHLDDYSNGILAGTNEYLKTHRTPAIRLLIASLIEATAALSTAEREREADALDAQRWRWFRQFLSVEDDAAEGGQYLFMWDDRIPEATFLPGFEHTVEELVDLRARVPSGGEEGR